MPAPPITAEIIDQSRQGMREAAEAWQRTFELTAEVTVGETTDLLTLVSQEAWNGPGLAVVFSQPSGAYVLLIADVSHTLPTWIAAPDATAKSKLATFAQELGVILLPEALLPTGSETTWLENGQEALLRCQPTASAEVLTLQIRCGEVTLPAVLLGCEEAANWVALEDKSGVSSVPPAKESAPPLSTPPEPAAPPRTMPTGLRFNQPPPPQDFEDGIPVLPSYTRSLLKIRVPVVASLASTKLPVGRILEIGPGTIIQFDQSCEQPLSLTIGEHEFAVGEAVKVGEKFGVRLTSMVMPAERFWSVKGRRE